MSSLMQLKCLHLQEATGVPQLKDRALVAQKNADIRKRKQALLAELPQLKAAIKKGKVTQEMVVARQERVCVCSLYVTSVHRAGPATLA